MIDSMMLVDETILFCNFLCYHAVGPSFTEVKRVFFLQYLIKTSRFKIYSGIAFVYSKKSLGHE
jgi:hypothetical protein